jgi:hypothetical protein
MGQGVKCGSHGKIGKTIDRCLRKQDRLSLRLILAQIYLCSLSCHKTTVLIILNATKQQ